MIFKTIQNFIDKDNLPNLLFYGSPGTGKTTMMHNIAKIIHGNKKEMVFEINGSEERGISYIKEHILNFCETESFSFFENQKKMLIIDEADSLTINAQYFLQSLMKKYHNSVSFCIICNYRNNIIDVIQSLCINYYFKPHTYENYSKILKENDETITDHQIKEIYEITNKDLRKGLNLINIIKNNEIENIYYFYNHPSTETLNKIYELLISNNNFKKKFDDIKNLIKTNNIGIKILFNKITQLYIQKNENINTELMKKIADIEYYITKDSNIDIHLLSFISLF